MRRRRLLATVGLAAGAGLAGCMRGPGPREATDPWVTREVEDDESHFSVRGTVRLRRGEFVPIRFETPGEGAAHMDIFGRTRLSLPMDALLFVPAEFEVYRRGEHADFLSGQTSLGGTRAGVDSRLPDGEYVYVIDNTKAGVARPLDEITFTFDLSVVN